MYRALLIVLLLPLILAAAPLSNKQIELAEQRIEMMQSFQYSDEKQCHTVIAGSKQSSVINLLVAAHAESLDKQAVIVALETAIKRGCDINERDHAGLPPLVAAVLFNDVVMVKFLLDHGADVSEKIRRKDSEVDGMTAQAFLNWLLEYSAKKGQITDRSEIQALLAEPKYAKDK